MKNRSACSALHASLIACAVFCALPSAVLAQASSAAPNETQSQSAVPSSAASASVTYTTKIDWEGRVVETRSHVDLTKAGLFLPEGRLEAFYVAGDNLAQAVLPAITSLLVDHNSRIIDAIRDGRIAATAPLELLAHKEAENESLSQDLTSWQATYIFPLDSMGAWLTHKESPVPIAPGLLAAPTRAFSGIIIYANTELPVHGEHLRASAQPCLFPRIFDSSMNLVLDLTRVDYRFIERYGIAAYTTAPGPAHVARIGTDPLRINALEVFGINRTDLIVSEADSAKILSLAANRKLLQEGRILIVLKTLDGVQK